jgi:hypothetical protein
MKTKHSPETVTITRTEYDYLKRDSIALGAIHQLLDGTEWGSETLDDVALIVGETGRTISEPDYEGGES